MELRSYQVPEQVEVGRGVDGGDHGPIDQNLAATAQKGLRKTEDCVDLGGDNAFYRPGVKQHDYACRQHAQLVEEGFGVRLGSRRQRGECDHIGPGEIRHHAHVGAASLIMASSRA
ncbi:MAG: hypothetical protein AAGE80_03825 [Pseudomonadota bacterium]